VQAFARTDLQQSLDVQESGLVALARGLFEQHVHVGNPSFDERFVVRCSDALLARWLLDGEAQSMLGVLRGCRLTLSHRTATVAMAAADEAPAKLRMAGELAARIARRIDALHEEWQQLAAAIGGVVAPNMHGVLGLVLALREGEGRVELLMGKEAQGEAKTRVVVPKRTERYVPSQLGENEAEDDGYLWRLLPGIVTDPDAVRGALNEIAAKAGLDAASPYR
jgi:hypothetical protein